jgi:hypothetical protein
MAIAFETGQTGNCQKERLSSFSAQKLACGKASPLVH